LPGTGKTTILKALVEISNKENLKVDLMCPTGIAAKKLSEVCEFDAKTIHKTLGFDGISWAKNEENTLNSDIIIIDEFSMVDQYVLYRILKATPQHKDFIMVFVGDHAQLPSVAPGNVLRELISDFRIPHVNLTKIFRQEEASDIILNAHVINNGSGQLVNRKGDFLFQHIDEHHNILITLENLVTKLKDKEFQVLSPTYKGMLGVTNINNRLQDLLNPITLDTKEFKSHDYNFRTGDRIMVIKNDYQNEVYNGEQGILRDIFFSSKQLEIEINNKIIHYYFNDAYNNIVLDYARTIHKVQSQEYDYVVMPFVKEFSIQLQRNLLYTAVTRAKKKVVIIGHTEALEKAIKNDDIIRRNTLFSERLDRELRLLNEDDKNKEA
jgi:exodeoxyribonuclease V alpha subunit